jgi:tRNA nucleotidyltransferase (CCA-adding enzyme)
MTAATWEHFEHRADMGIRGIGPDMAEAFAQAALAMTAIITDPAGIRAERSIRLECREPDPELLFIDWLNRVIFEMATRVMLFNRFDVHISDPGELQAEIHGEPVDRSRHAPAVEIKGASFTELVVRQRPDGLWVAQCVVDV